MQCEGLPEKVTELSTKLESLQAKVQANADASSNIISSASNVLTHADTLVSVYLVVITIAVSLIGLSITIYLNKKRNDYIEEASSRITKQLLRDDALMGKVIRSLIEDPSIRDNITNAIDSVVEQRASTDDKSNFKNDLT